MTKLAHLNNELFDNLCKCGKHTNPMIINSIYFNLPQFILKLDLNICSLNLSMKNLNSS